VHTHYGHCLFLQQRSCLIVSIQTPLDDAEFTALGTQVSDLVGRYHCHGTILDLSGLDVVDSFSVHNLQRLCGLLQVHSVTTVITGIQASIAISMALRGLTLRGVTIAVDLTDALALLERASGPRAPSAGSYPSLH
jgi:rsbT antagonist protein RsbS